MTEQEECPNVQNVVDLNATGNRLIEETLKFESFNLRVEATIKKKRVAEPINR